VVRKLILLLSFSVLGANAFASEIFKDGFAGATIKGDARPYDIYDAKGNVIWKEIEWKVTNSNEECSGTILTYPPFKEATIQSGTLYIYDSNHGEGDNGRSVTFESADPISNKSCKGFIFSFKLDVDKGYGIPVCAYAHVWIDDGKNSIMVHRGHNDFGKKDSRFAALAVNGENIYDTSNDELILPEGQSVANIRIVNIPGRFEYWVDDKKIIDDKERYVAFDTSKTKIRLHGWRLKGHIQARFYDIQCKLIKNELNEVESTYNDPDPSKPVFVETQRAQLNALLEKGVFDKAHAGIITQLNKNHAAFFEEQKNYKIIAVATGPILMSDKLDSFYITYDTLKQKIVFLFYSSSQNAFKTLYDQIPVIDDLAEVNDRYRYAGTNDYIIGELISDNHDNHFNHSDLCKIADISKDETFVLERGVFAKGYSKNDPVHLISLCLSLDLTYNNWECFYYDKRRTAFVKYYGQAFSD
jgi:hypothetical protein